MSATHFKYVVVGGGGAGSAAVAAIRRCDAGGSILLVGQESSRPYNRTALSKAYLRRETTRLAIATDPVGWYAEHHIDMRSSRRASHLDTARQSITLNTGEDVAFDRLLLATGASPRLLNVPGADLPNVFYLRTIDDCDRILHAIDNARAGGRTPRVAIIGGGLLSAELTAAFAAMKIDAMLIISAAHPASRFAGETIGRAIGRQLVSLGAAVNVNAAVTKLEGDGRVQRIIQSDGLSVDCDFVVAAVGVTPNRELLRGTPISAEKSILVNESCQTNIPNIFAAGDCAAILDPLFGKHRLLDHWSSATQLGTIAGENMAGGSVKYSGVNSFECKLGEMKLRVWGEARFVDRRIVRANIINAGQSEIAEIGVDKDGRVSQVAAVGFAGDFGAFEALVQTRFAVNGREERLKDPKQTLHDFPSA